MTRRPPHSEVDDQAESGAHIDRSLASQPAGPVEEAKALTGSLESGAPTQPRWSRRDRWGLAVSGLVVIVGSVLLASSGWFDAALPAGRHQNLASSPTTVDDIATGLSRWPPTHRVRAPTLSGRTLSGKRLSLQQFRGQVVVLNVWGSWCAPCRAEAPDLHRVATETRAQGVQFIGIDTRDDDSAARAFVRRYGIRYPSLLDDGLLLLALRDTVPTKAIPSTIVLDRDGRAAARVVGRIRYSTLRGLVDDVVAEQFSPSTTP